MTSRGERQSPGRATLHHLHLNTDRTNPPGHGGLDETAASEIKRKKRKRKEKNTALLEILLSSSLPLIRPSLPSNRTPAAGSMCWTTLPDVLPATSPCHQGENWSHLKFRVTGSDWSRGGRREGRRVGFEMGGNSNKNKTEESKRRNGRRLSVKHILTVIIISLRRMICCGMVASAG